MKQSNLSGCELSQWSRIAWDHSCSVGIRLTAVGLLLAHGFPDAGTEQLRYLGHRLVAAWSVAPEESPERLYISPNGAVYWCDGFGTGTLSYFVPGVIRVPVTEGRPPDGTVLRCGPGHSLYAFLEAVAGRFDALTTERASDGDIQFPVELESDVVVGNW